MRRGKSLVQVEMDDINIHITWPRDSDQSIHVGPVHVDKTSFAMDNLRDSFYIHFKNTESVGVGDHQSRHIFGHVLGEAAEVDCASVVRLDFLDAVAADMSARRVCPVG